MADSKVTQLVALTGAGTAAVDLIPIIDVSAGTAGSKSITVAELLVGLAAVPKAGGTMTGPLIVPSLEVRGARTSGTNENVLTISDPVTGVQTGGFGQRIRWTSNAGGSVAAIGFEVAGDGSNNQTQISLYTQSSGASGLLNRMVVDENGKVGIGGTPNAAAILDVASTTLGFLPPRMTTTQRNAVTTPPEGLLIYNSTTGKLNVRGASAWEAVTSA